MKIYLDVCCLNRPFDDQLQARVRLESEAILLILENLDQKVWEWISSDVVKFEIDRIADDERRRRVSLLAGFAHSILRLESADLVRSAQLEALGMKGVDALHVAYAERAGCDVLLTTDDRLLSLAKRNAERLNVHVANPLAWLDEEIKR
jgi:predicted nucleic acid-binding protein